MSELALQIIAENKKTKKKTLNLGNCGLTEVPQEAMECEWVTTLILSGGEWEYEYGAEEWVRNQGPSNHIFSLPSNLHSLPFLRKLVAVNQQISDLTPLADLTKLEELYISYNKVSDLSPISNLLNLKILSSGYNQIKDLSCVYKLNNLFELSVSSNEIADISPICELFQLQRINCGNNKIRDLFPLSDLTCNSENFRE